MTRHTLVLPPYALLFAVAHCVVNSPNETDEYSFLVFDSSLFYFLDNLLVTFYFYSPQQ